MKVHADGWFSGEDADEYWAEGVKVEVEVELTDADEVRIGIRLSADSSDTTTVYLSRNSAEKLSRFLAAAAVDDLELARV